MISYRYIYKLKLYFLKEKEDQALKVYRAPPILNEAGKANIREGGYGWHLRS